MHVVDQEGFACATDAFAPDLIHTILPPSHCAEGLTSEQVEVKVLGDLSEEEAKRYVFGCEGEGRAEVGRPCFAVQAAARPGR